MKLQTIILVIFFIIGYSKAGEWKYDQGYRDELLFLHTFENYSLNPHWQMEWEKNVLAKSALRFNFGSVEIHDLLTDARLIINEYLNGGWWFQADFNWYESHFVNKELKYFYFGMEKNIFCNVALFFQFNPAFDKEEIDARFGLNLINADRDQFLRMGVILEDFLWEEKNDYNGRAVKYPKGLFWQIRNTTGKINFFSEGRISTGYKREYQEEGHSNLLRSEEQKENTALAKLYYIMDENKFIETGFYHYNFFERNFFFSGSEDYSYSNKIQSFHIQYIFPVKQNFVFRISGRYIRQMSNASGFKNYTYKRDEWMPSFFCEYFYGKHVFELAVMNSFYNWDYDEVKIVNDYAEHERSEKIKLGWTYSFNENTRLQISLSHVFSIWGFGGGNIQYMMFF